MAEGTIKISGYNTQEQIHIGSTTWRYKGIRKNNQKPVLIKITTQRIPQL